MPEQTLDERLDDLIEGGMAITKRWASLWNTSVRYFFSDQLHGRKKRKRWEWVVLNYIWPSAMQEIAKLSRNFPKIIAKPYEESDIEAAEVWEETLNWQWRKGINGRGMRQEQMSAILDGKLFGYRVSKIFWEDKDSWDEEAQEWKGDVKHKLWHPAFFWADGQETIEEGNVGTQRYVRLDWAQHRWPKFKDELKEQAVPYGDIAAGFSTANIYGSDTGGTPSGDQTGNSDSLSDVRTVKPNRLMDMVAASDPMTHTGYDQKIEYVRIDEVWFRDDEEKNVKIEEDVNQEELIASGQIEERDGIFIDVNGDFGAKGEPVPRDKWPKKTIRKYKRPVYPRGRHVVRADKVILNPDKEDQVYKYSRWPFIVTPHYLLPHMWQGIDSVQMYKSTQDMINISASHLYNNMRQYGDPKIVVENGAIATPPGKQGRHYRIGAGAGSVIKLVKGALNRNAFKIIDPPQISAGAIQLYGLFAQEYKNIQGLQSIAKGEKQPGKMTATESQFLAVSSNDRIQLQSVYEDQWVTGVASLMAEVMQDKYDEGRFVRIVGEDSNNGIIQITEREKSVKFDIDVIAGTTLPFDEEKRLAKILQADQLLRQPPTPLTPTILKELEVPNYKKILAEYEQYQNYLQFLGLMEQVQTGQIEPQQAVKLLMQKAVQISQGNQEGG